MLYSKESSSIIIKSVNFLLSSSIDFLRKDIIDKKHSRDSEDPKGIEGSEDPGSSKGSNNPEGLVKKIDSLRDNGLKVSYNISFYLC